MNLTNFNGKCRKCQMWNYWNSLVLSHCTLLKKSKVIPRSQRCSYTHFTDTEIIRTIWKNYHTSVFSWVKSQLEIIISSKSKKSSRNFKLSLIGETQCERVLSKKLDCVFVFALSKVECNKQKQYLPALKCIYDVSLYRCMYFYPFLA